MSKFFHLTKRSKVNQAKNKRFNFSFKSLNIVVTLLVVVSGVAYLIQVNSLAVKGYKIKDLETKVDQLKTSNQDLALQVSDLQSLGNLKSKVSQLNMVNGAKTEYLNPTPVALAR